MKVAIIGGGPSGLSAAYYAKGEIHVYDKNSDCGKKLLLTGNGKCNYFNKDQDFKYYHSYNKELIKVIINDKNINKVREFTKSIGIIPKYKNNYCYPYSGLSSSVKESLKKACTEKGVFFHFNEEIKDIKYLDNKFYINNIPYDKVIISTGAKSYPKTGSDGFGYQIAQKFKHHINPVNPSLVQVITNTGFEKSWAGIRCDVIVSHYENKSLIKQETGELQFTDYGLSGICIFNLSRDIKIGLENNKKEYIHINFIPWYNEDNFLEFMNKRNKSLPSRNITELCDGFLNYKLLMILLKKVGIKNDVNWNDLSENDKKKFVNILTDFEVEIIDTKGFDNAQTCSGGIPLEELNLKTLESLKQKGLYFCGEVVDLDGDCGGYNLTFAFLSGILVGSDIHD